MKTDVEDDNDSAAAAVEDREDNGHDCLAAEAKTAEDLLPVPVVTHRALVKRGYTIDKQIGQGGYGSVLVARSKRHHSQVAIKVVEKLSDGLIDFGKLWSIKNERTFAELFDHPYLNVYYEMIHTTNR